MRTIIEQSLVNYKPIIMLRVMYRDTRAGELLGVGEYLM